MRDMTMCAIKYSASISRIGFGIPKICPRPNQKKLDGNSGIDWPMDSLKDNPLAIIIMPSVTMKGGMRKVVIMNPLKAPAKAHTAMLTVDAMTTEATLADRPPSQSLSRMETQTDASATREPTERSMPAVMMTMVIPIAMMA